MSRNLLLITQYAPPRPAAAARRLGQLARWGQEHYDRVFLIRGDRDYPGPELEGVTVFPIRLRDLRSLASSKRGAGTLPAGRKPLGLLRFRQAFPLVYLTDDGGLDYRRKAYARAVEIVRTHGITTVLSSFRPWSDHLVARRLKGQFPDLRWIADFRDLPVDPVRRDVWWPALQRWWLRRTIAPADEVWAVSRGQAEQLRPFHPRVTVRRGWPERLPPSRTAPVTERFTIVYTGSIYPRLQTIRSLVVVLNGLPEPERIELIYCGKDAWLWRRWTANLDGKIHSTVRGTLAPAAAQNVQENAQVLLLLNWSAPGYYGVLTAKLWDYLAAGRPILALVNGPGDEELSEIIEGADAGAVVPVRDRSRLQHQLTTWYATWRKEGVLRWTPKH